MEKKELLKKTKRPPRWDREEVVILVSEYFRTKGLPISDRNKSVEIISSVLRHRAIIQNKVIDSTFRNQTGIYMKFKNIASLDREVIAEGNIGLKNASILEKEIVEEYYHDSNKIDIEAHSLMVKYIPVKKKWIINVNSI